MKRRDNPHQLLIEWQTPPAKPAVTRVPTAGNQSPLTLRLKWDFKTTFPQPTDEAIDAGVIDASDTEPENLKSLHENYARECLASLKALDQVMDARRRGVDPGTQQKPRTHASRERLRKYFNEEPDRLKHAFHVLIDTYGEAFGDEPAAAFEKALRAWHAGVQVETETLPTPKAEAAENIQPAAKPRPKRIIASLPVPKPLPRAITEARFGQTDRGPVRPSAQEVREITETHADRIIDALCENSRADITPLIQMYADDFGEEAARRLEAYCRRQLAGATSRCGRRV